MNNKFSKKVTGLLLISHLTLSALPITALGVEESTNTSNAPIENVGESYIGESDYSVPNQEDDKVNVEEAVEVENEKTSDTSTIDSSTQQETTSESEETSATQADGNVENSDKSIQARNIQDAHVSTTEEFESALKNPLVQNIYLESNIVLKTSFNITTNKNIYGNGYTIDLNYYTVGLTFEGAVGNIENVTLINQQILPLFWSEYKDVTVNYKDVTSTGRQFIYLSQGVANLYGNINASADAEENFQGGELNIRAGANVDFKNTSYVNAIFSKTGVLVEEGAILNVESKGISLYAFQAAEIDIRGEANFDSSTQMAIYAPVEKSYMTIYDNAKLRATSKMTGNEAIMMYNGSLIVKSGATFEASSEGVESTIQTGDLLKFESGSNFIVTNTQGPALGAYANPTDVSIESLQGMSTWAVGETQTESPTNSYSGYLTAVFSTNTYTIGQITSNLISNNPDFQTNFSSGQVGKIAGGSFVKGQEITPTTVNEVTNEDTEITGEGEPNASIEITVGGTVIANGRIGSDGKYRLSIPVQKEGAVIKAQSSLNGIKSNIASTVVTAVPVVVEGTITPESYNISSGDKFLRGTYTGDVASARVYVNGVSVRGGDFAQGNFEFFVGNRIQSVRDVVEIEALDQNGKTLDRKIVELSQNLTGSITAANYRVGETMITGTFTGDVNFARLVINGKPSNAWGGTFNADGTFSFYAAKLGIKDGDKVEIQALNRQVNGNSEAIEVLETKEVTVINQLKGTITPDKYSPTDTTITGTFTGDVNFANLVIDGKSVSNWGGTFNKETGRFEFFVHSQFRDKVKNASKVEVQTYHRETVNGKTVDNKLVLQPVEIVKAAGTIQPATFKVTDSEITGTFTGDVNFANLIVDGRSISWGGSFETSTKTFTFFVNQPTRDLIRDAEKVELVAYNREVISGRPVDTKLDRSVVTIDKDSIGTIIPNEYKLGDRVLTGTYTGDSINFGRLEIDGTTLWVSGFANGTFTAYLNPEQASRVTTDSNMIIYGLHRYENLSTKEIAQASVSITE